MNDLEVFFRALKVQYAKEGREFVWDWEMLEEISEGRSSPPGMTSEMVHFIAYNLAKNVMHGPLPSHLHSRMIFDRGDWSRRYVEFLER